RDETPLERVTEREVYPSCPGTVDVRGIAKCRVLVVVVLSRPGSRKMGNPNCDASVICSQAIAVRSRTFHSRQRSNLVSCHWVFSSLHWLVNCPHHRMDTLIQDFRYA